MPKTPNPYNRKRKPDAPYEIWSNNDGSWKYYVLRKYKNPVAEAADPYAKWYCKVLSPATPNGEFGDVYAANVKASFTKIYDFTSGGTHDQTSKS